MKVATNQERLVELFDSDPKNDSGIAAELGVSKQTISAWRSGFRSPKKPMLIKIAELYNVSIEWLMGFDVERNYTPRQLPIIVPSNEEFIRIVQHMTTEDYETVMTIFERTYKAMKAEEEKND